MGLRRALLVANDRYIDDSLADLYAPREEARDLLSLLADPDVGAFDQFRLLENESKSAIEREIESMLRAAGPEDMVLLYFSGHGVRSSKRGRLHLAVANTEVDHLSSTAISASFIRELLDESDAASSVLLLDCCYSGAFEGLGLKAADDDLALDGELRTGYGRYVITATNSVERADDGRPATGTEPGSRSAFTGTIIQGLSTGAADITGQGRITPDDLWRYVHLELPKRSAQTPCQFGSASDEIHIALSREGQHRQRLRRDQRDPRLGDLLGKLESAGDVPLCATDWRRRGLLKVPVGQAHRIDQPAGEPVWLDLASAEGHLLVVGRAGTGKTTLLRTIIAGLALTHSDDEVAIHCLESGGNWLGPMQRLPHVRTVLGDDQLSEVSDLLDRMERDVLDRKQLFRRHSLESPTSLRARRGELDAGPCPDVFLIVDRWQDFATLLENFAPRVVDLANKGLGYGFHVVILDRSWRSIPEELRELPQTRIETRLSQPHESLVNPDQAARLPLNMPGWAIHGRRTFRIALPEPAVGETDLKAEAEPATPEEADRLVSLIAKAWGTPQANTRPESHRLAGETLRSEALTLLNLPDPTALQTFAGHPTPTDEEYLRIPIGVDEAGEPVRLDLKEAAQGGMGPHGLLVGATGSGKSELLRTIVVTLAARHSSADLNFIMLDFKGGSTFATLDALPHTSAVITNLEDELSLVDRLEVSLFSELTRRQELLRTAGNYPSRAAYEAARLAGAALDPLPSLLVICDGFIELLAVRTEVIDLLVAIGRLGRSLGVHLLLAAQRLEEGTLRGLESHLSYRICLRTFSAAESRMVLGVPDAAELPNAPGHGLLKDGAALRRFRATYVSGAPALTGTEETGVPQELAGLSVLDLVLDRLRGGRPTARQVWLPPLAVAPSLDQLLPPLARHPRRGLNVPAAAALTAPVGVVDIPHEQRQAPLRLDLSGADGNVAVVGAPRSGKSTLLHALVAALALTHTPREVQFLCLDLSGGAMGGLGQLPHVSGVAGRRDTEAVRRTVAEAVAVLAAREGRFSEHGIDSMATYRRRRAVGEFADDPFGDVFLVVDGWNTLRQDYEELEQNITYLAARGLGFGVHVIVTAVRWAEIRINMRDLLGTKLELRLGDPAESEIDRRAAQSVPAGSPGHGLTRDKLHFLTALARIDGGDTVEDLSGATGELAHQVAAAWPGPPAPPVRLLPRQLSVAELNERSDPAAGGLPIGVDEAALAPVYLELNGDPHLSIFGDAECGKTNLLRLIARGIVERYTPAQARLVIADYRRGLLGAVEGDHLLDYAPSNQAFSQGLGSIYDALQGRLPGPDVTPAQLRDRSWWQGPDLYILVDDYDLVASGGNNPLSVLHELLPLARDIGLHLIIARRMGGVSRALYEPVLQRLRELDSPALLMSGDRDEGQLFGGLRPQRLPAGRGTLVRRRDGVRLIQTAWSEP